MRILLTTDSYPPPLVGGRDLQAKMLAQELAARGHRVAVACLAGGAGARTEWDGPVRVHRLSGWSRLLSTMYVDRDKPFHPTITDPGLAWKLRRLLSEFRPDIVQARSWLLYSLLPLLPTQDTRLIVSIHEYGFVCPKNTYVYQGGTCSGPAYLKCVRCAKDQYGWAKAWALKTGLSIMSPMTTRVDRYVANSTATAQASGRLTGPGGPSIQVITPMVPDRFVEQERHDRPAFVPSTGPYLMFAGGLGPYKGLNVLIEAWLGLTPRIPLVLAGVRRPDTPDQFPEGVLVAEEVPHEEVMNGWAHSLAAIVPSVWPEPFGTVAVEAMAVGVPVVASAVGGLIDIIVDGTTGILVPAGDVDSLRAALQLLMNDPRRRLAMGEAARVRAHQYMASVVVKQWEQLFREVLKQNVTAPR